MPDFKLISADSHVNEPPAAWEPDQKSLDVFLAVPEYRPGGYNVAAASRERSRSTSAA